MTSQALFTRNRVARAFAAALPLSLSPITAVLLAGSAPAASAQSPTPAASTAAPAWW